MTDTLTSNERLQEIRDAVAEQLAVTANRRYKNDAYADRIWLLQELDRLSSFEEQTRHLERRIRELTEQLNCLKLDRQSSKTCDQRDAERYRQLRKGNDYKHSGPMVVLCETDHMESDERPFWVLSQSALDEAVDKIRGSEKAIVVPSICEKPMPDGKGAGQCINPPGHEGDCDDMPF